MAKKKKRAELEAGEKLEEGRNLKEREKHDLDNNVDLVSGEPNKKKNKKKHKRDKTGTDEVGYESPTVSIALPGSIIDNTQSLELATRLAGQVARAATIFRIDEVVVFDNKNSSENDSGVTTLVSSDENESGAAFLIRILQYLETPQYLRKALFPKHNNLRFVGMLPPLDAPHHLRKHEWAAYREGVTLKEKAPNSMRTMVDVGLSKICHGWLPHPPNLGKKQGCIGGTKCDMLLISGGYDHLIGTSEHGQIINSSELNLPVFRHLLIAFGGLAGLEESIEGDDNFKGKNVREVFHSYLNTCPFQGSRTIRTEEAIFISLQYFQEAISRAMQSANS